MTNTKPSMTQLSALLRFGQANGRTWKSNLRACWENPKWYGLFSADDAGETAILQGVRNQFGPSWLARTTLDRIAACFKGGE